MQTVHLLGRTCRSVVATRCIRHLSSTADSSPEKVYELRFYQMKPEYYRESLDLLERYWPVRTAHSCAVGSWMTEIGGICETVHLWEYDGLGDRMRKRQAVAEDQVWTKEFVPLFLERSLKLTNILVALEPGTSLVTDFGQCPCPSGPGIYELHSSGPYGPLILDGDGETTVGKFTTIYGPIPAEYVLLRYSDPDAAAEAALARRRGQSLKGYSRIMVPARWSPLQ